ncbi:unnamed protein product [Phytomonas sp. EM1]|nr:unnamed protein product [Phytomonas sp. EM1]|eukprot:CCW64759.1 unnamed protein product [Phytomonas sp. isolate EM1]
MPNRGLIDYAHLRLREAHPGPNQYKLKPVIGANSDSLKKSISNRIKGNATSSANAATVGPGTYLIASSIGTGRAADFSPHSANNDAKMSPLMRSPTLAFRGDSAKSARRSRNASPHFSRSSSEIKRNTSNEERHLVPGSPAFTIRGRLKGYFDVTPGNTCLGTYTLPSCFDSPSRKNPLDGTFGGRHEAPEEREKRYIPGPGTYNATPLDSARAIRILDRTDRCASRGQGKEGSGHMGGPGPAAYGDPTTIAHRLRKQIPAYQQWTGVTTFASRPDSSLEEFRSSMTPGPGAYNLAQASDFLDLHKNHSTVVLRPATVSSESARQAGRLKGTNNGSGDSGQETRPLSHYITLPSDFDHDCRKGVPMLGRNWAGCCNPSNKVHANDTTKLQNTTRCTKKTESFHLADRFLRTLPAGGRFASHPYGAEPSERIRKHTVSETDGKDMKSLDQDVKNSIPGPGSYDPKLDAVLPRTTCAILSGSPHASAGAAYGELTAVSSAAQQLDANGVSLTGKQKNPSPGPGHYYPDHTVTYPKVSATTFSKGDFHVRNGMPPWAMTEAASRPGAGANYNDTTLYSRSITGDVMHGIHAKTFGTRYPARALYQVCKQRDETTNTNCIYPDEYAFYFGSIETNDKTVK